MPSDRESEISDMCGDFGRNFEEIPSLPEQTAAKIVDFCSAAREKARQNGVCHFVDTLKQPSG